MSLIFRRWRWRNIQFALSFRRTAGVRRRSRDRYADFNELDASLERRRMPVTSACGQNSNLFEMTPREYRAVGACRSIWKCATCGSSRAAARLIPQW